MLEENIEVLSKKISNIRELLKDLSPAPLSVEPSKKEANILTVKLNNNYLYSKYAPMEETRRWITREIENKETIPLFAGLGLGYQLEIFIEQYPYTPLILIEPNLSLLKTALEIRDLRKVFLHEKLIIILEENPSSLDIPLQALAHKNIKFLPLQPLYNIYQEKFDIFKNYASKLLNRIQTNNNTLKKFGHLWIRNILLNTKTLLEANNVTDYLNWETSFPVLIIGAGPSLQKHIPFLREYQKRLVIVAVDTALSIIRREGIEPDFTLVVDPQHLNAQHLYHTSSPNSILIAEPSIYPSIFRMPWRDIALIHSTLPLMTTFEKETSFKGELKSGGSVGTLAWDFAKELNTKEIYAVGLDLSYPSLRNYTEGTLYSRKMLSSAHRFEPTQQQQWRTLLIKDKIKLPSYSQGEETLSDKRLLVYQRWLEDHISLYPEIENFTLSPLQAVKIEGFKVINEEDIFLRPIIRPEIEKYLNKRVQEIKKEKKDYDDSFLDNLLKETTNIRECSYQILQILEKKRKENTLESLQRKIESSPLRYIIGFLFYPLLNQIVEINNKEDNLTELTQELYKNFYESSLFHEKWLKVAICLKRK